MCEDPDDGGRLLRSCRALGSVLLACGIAAASLCIGGCGETATFDPLAKAADVTSNSDGARIAIVEKVSASGLSQPVEVKASGYTDERKRSGWMVMDFSNFPGLGSTSGAQSAELVFAYPNIYMKLPFLSSHLPSGKSWMEINVDAAAKAHGIDLAELSSLNEANPDQYLDFVRSTGNVQSLGSQTIDGVRTTRYRATIELSRVAERAPVDRRAIAEASVKHMEQLTGLSSMPMEVWIDAQQRIRRMRIFVQETVAGRKIELDTTTDYISYGPIPPIDVPAPEEVFNATSVLAAGLKAH